jgi:predicted nucleotidyltransferase
MAFGAVVTALWGTATMTAIVAIATGTAGLTTIAVVSGIFSLLLATLGYIRFESQRPAPPFIPLERRTHEALRSEVRLWLLKRLPDKELHVEQAFLFGSIVYDHINKSEDIDLLVCFEPLTDKQLRRAVLVFKGSVSKDFKNAFGLPLHLQFFSADEKARFDDFVGRLGKREALNISRES